jgi:hypothetical protein
MNVTKSQKSALSKGPAKDHPLVVVHPLDDVAEEKIDVSSLKPIKITGAVKLSLMALRGYLILMAFLVLYHVAVAVGMFGTHAN